MSTWVVAKGDTIPGIALATGFYWKTLWNHGENADLKDSRKNPNVLFSGDEVFVPELQQKWESRPTEQRHKFRRKGDPIQIVIRLVRGGEPRANEDYILEVAPKSYHGSTDGDGVLKEYIPADATRGLLRLSNGQELIPVKIGHLDPVDEVTGVQQRLYNLGYDCKETGEVDDATVRALSRFQSDNQLDVTGEIDDSTKDKLLSLGQ